MYKLIVSIHNKIIEVVRSVVKVKVEQSKLGLFSQNY